MITRILEVPTGHILIVETPRGKLECLSLGDYGKDFNIKCDALGLKREPERVRHRALLPLDEKWVVTISTQYGCSMGCTFCDVPRVGPGLNATASDMADQFLAAIELHPEVKECQRLNLHFARMGEPTWNPEVFVAAAWFWRFCRGRGWRFHPVVSTMMPKRNRLLSSYVETWASFKNDDLGGEAGLQISINSTDDLERERMFNGNAAPLDDVAEIASHLPKPLGRKYTLNFAVAGWTVSGRRLRELFDPAKFLIKLTPMHRTAMALEHGIETVGDYTEFHPYRRIEEDLKAHGFDVLVFIASEEEDLGRITCGNAILSGTRPLIKYSERSP